MKSLVLFRELALIAFGHRRGAVRMSINIPLLAKKVSEKEADVRVHVRTRVVQIQRRRLGIGREIIDFENLLQADKNASQGKHYHDENLIYFAVVLLVSFCEFIQPTSICPISHNLSEISL